MFFGEKMPCQGTILSSPSTRFSGFYREEYWVRLGMVLWARGERWLGETGTFG